MTSNSILTPSSHREEFRRPELFLDWTEYIGIRRGLPGRLLERFRTGARSRLAQCSQGAKHGNQD